MRTRGAQECLRDIIGEVRTADKAWAKRQRALARAAKKEAVAAAAAAAAGAGAEGVVA